ncbi:hypothetical protein GCM10020000_43190 [Streptomyces olivoverticillatus]
MRYVDMPDLHNEIYSSLVGGMSTGSAREDLSSLGKTALRLLMAATSPALLLEGASRHEPLAYQLPPLEIPQGNSLFSLMQNLPDYELSPKYKEAAAIVAENAARGAEDAGLDDVRAQLDHLGTAAGQVRAGGCPRRNS